MKKESMLKKQITEEQARLMLKQIDFLIERGKENFIIGCWKEYGFIIPVDDGKGQVVGRFKI